jgi:23S rRNA (uracil1939-C5)-methyltransferase
MTVPDTTILISLEKPVYGGYCLGRHNGKAVLIPYGIPGESVFATITAEKNDFCFASIAGINEKHQERITADCPHFTRCGGCSYLHVAYGQELQFKNSIVKDSLTRIAGLSEENIPDIVSIHAGRYNYRSHGTLKAENGNPGFHRKGTNDFVPIGKCGCLLLAEELNAWLNREEPIPDDCRIAVDASLHVVTSLQDDPVVVDTACGLTYARSINQFFQANRFLRERMIEIVRDYAGLERSEVFLDIGCGVGFFSLALAGHALSGTCIDISGENIRWAKHNARHNRITNLDFHTMPSNRLDPGRIHPDVIVADPPRAGIDKNTRKTIMAMRPSRIVYVSCNPSTFARDSKDFINAGYSLEQLTLVDMFPGTHHIELISRFGSSRISLPV